MRDTRKDKEYFDKYMKYQNTRIDKKEAKLEDADEDKKQRILVSLTSYGLDLLKAEFSMGAAKDELKSLLNRVIKIVGDYKNITYEDLLNLISLSIMVNDKSEVIKLIKFHQDKIEKDRLLNFLSMYILGKQPIWDKGIDLSEEFTLLNKVFEAKSKEA